MNNQNINPSDISAQIARLLPEEFIRKHKVLPVKLDGEYLEVACCKERNNLSALSEIHLITGLETQERLFSEVHIQELIDTLFSVEKSTKQAIVDMRMQEKKEAKAHLKKREEEEIDEEIDSALSTNQPIVKLLNNIIQSAIIKNASDIHMEPQEPEMRIRYRIDGILQNILTIPKHVEQTLISRTKIIADLDITEKRRPQDGHYSHSYKGQNYDIRVSCVPTIKGEKIVLRILDKSRMSLGLSDLGFSTENTTQLNNLVHTPYGMLLVTGPTGSGKTTSLYALLNCLDRNEFNIVTAEDPVEYRLSGINQTQINSKIGLNFSHALRSFLRQDPNVIMVGEIRDYETAEIAIQAALTGHMVLSTLHTNDAASAVTRLNDMGVEPFLIASTVVGVIAQRLARKLCSDCKGKGCNKCQNSGQRGRTVIYELLEINDKISQLIVKNASASDIKAAMVEDGMMTFEECGRSKIRSGICHPQELKAVIGLDY
ncbi:MAG: GspE/PulE family protein [bacterium]